MIKRLASISVLALLIVGVTAIQEVRSGTFPGANGRIAFIYNTNGVPRVATVSPTGKDLRILVRNPSGYSGAFESRPQWSPDGGRILVVRDSGSQSHLLVVKADGTGVTDLGVFGGASPSWHPNGTTIAYSQAGDVYVADLSALGAPTLLVEDAIDPVWSPDGTKIAFTRLTVDFVRHIWVADSTGGGQTQRTFAVKPDLSGQSHASWSPDSSTLAYQSGEFGSSSVHVGIVNATGSPVEAELTTVGKNANPIWSPDGTKIGFWSSRGTGFWTMGPDGSDQARAFTWVGSGFDWQPLSVTLRTSRSTLTFGSMVTLTAHVVPSPPSGEVRFYRIPAGSNVKRLIGGGVVDGTGDRSITFKPGGSATYVVEWLGDVMHTLGHYWSEIRSVVVRIRITGEMRGGYATRIGVRLYHFASSCPNHAQGCPISVFHVATDHTGKSILITLQEWRNGGWRTNVSKLWRLRDGSRVGIIWIYPDEPALVVGHPFRVRARFRGDVDHAPASTDWLRFKVTS
jgi:Tol biopolymer transport system component